MDRVIHLFDTHPLYARHMRGILLDTRKDRKNKNMIQLEGGGSRSEQRRAPALEPERSGYKSQLLTSCVTLGQFPNLSSYKNHGNAVKGGIKL